MIMDKIIKQQKDFLLAYNVAPNKVLVSEEVKHEIQNSIRHFAAFSSEEVGKETLPIESELGEMGVLNGLRCIVCLKEGFRVVLESTG